jgi:hypothetical protein
MQQRGRPYLHDLARIHKAVRSHTAAASPDTPRFVHSASVMKSPIRRTGLICARGSWNTIDIRFRYERSSPPLNEPASRPPNRICPSTSAPGGRSRLTARAVIVLPRAGLAHQANRLARVHRQGHAAQHGPPRARDVKPHRQVVELEQRLA